MDILVIEDKEMHQQSARETLKGHEVTIVGSYDDARELLEVKFDFDVVLTDMNMPMSKKTLEREAFKPNEQVPYGFVLALMAAHGGAKFVAMVTDTNHHQGAMSAALDNLCPSYLYHPSDAEQIKRFVINGAEVIFVHTPFVHRISKDAPCTSCKENIGVCCNCNGTGLNKNPDSKPRECHLCSHTDMVGKCTRCKGTGRYDRTDTLKTKDWGSVLAVLCYQSSEPTLGAF